MKTTFLLTLHALICTILVAQPLPLDERVRIGTLDNGMTYYIQHNTKPQDRAEIRLAVKAGSILEDEDQLGLAHFVEHMAFNGSEHFEKNELVQYLEKTGTKFGPDLNAYTSFDETVYMLQVRTDDPEILSNGLLIFRDWAGGLLFDHEEIDKERGVVMSEWRTRLSPEQRMAQEYYPVMYYDSRYAQRLPIGEPEIIEHAPYEAFKRFYTDWYRPDLMAIAIVGDIDVDSMEKEILSRFSSLKNPDEARTRVRYNVPPHDDTKVAILSDKEATFSNARLFIKHPHQPVVNEMNYQDRIKSRLVNDMLNERLKELTQLAEPPFTMARSSYGSNVGDIDAYSLFVLSQEGHLLDAFEAAMIEVERVRRHGFTQSELDRQKLDIMTKVESAVKEQDKVDSRGHVMRYVYHFLDQNPALSPEQQLDLYQRLMMDIPLEDVNKMANQWLTDNNRVIIMTMPENDKILKPTEQDVLDVLNHVAGMALEPYEEEVISEPLFTKDIQPGSIAEVVNLPEIETEEWHLSNGATVVVKQTDFKNDEVLMRATSKGGYALYDDDTYEKTQFAASIERNAGVSKFSNTQLEKMLAGKIVSVSPYINSNYEGIVASSSPDDLETMFQMVHLFFTEPRQDADAAKSFANKNQAIYANLLSNPTYYFMDYVMRKQEGDHARSGFPTTEDLTAIDYDEVMKLYKERYADASDFTFVVVGNFDKEQLKTYVNTYIGSLPATHSAEGYGDLGIEYPQGIVHDEFEYGLAPKSQVNLVYLGEAPITPTSKYIFDSMIHALGIKLREALREDKGGVYGVRLSGNMMEVPKDRYQLDISFNADPDRVKELVEETHRVIAQYQQEEFTSDDLIKTSETQKQELIKNLKENTFWVQKLISSYQLDKDPRQITLDNLVQLQTSLTPANLKEAMNQYFNHEHFYTFIMNPQSAGDAGVETDEK